jgi:glycosyltransferase involved in cell wall biosynthesis
MDVEAAAANQVSPMPARETATSPSPPIWFLGTIPPPITGHTLLTEKVLQALQRAGPIKFVNWSPGTSRRGIKFRVRRVARILASMVRLLCGGRGKDAPLYIVANSQAGLYLTLLLVQIGRGLGYRVYLHHHTYYYIDEYDWRMARIDRAMGPRGVHVVHCDQMAQDFAARYPTRCGFARVYPSIVASPLGSPRRRPHAPFRLGHLSNLSVAKGLDLVLATFRALRADGRQVHLTLAGPYHTQEARQLVERAVGEYPEAVEYAGPVYGEQKVRYLEGIDCFLFPSRSESWGIVLHESMGVGAPVITMRRGCTPTVVGTRAGVIVDREADFVATAVHTIERWIDQPDEYGEASQAAIDQAAFLQREGERTLREFASSMFSVHPTENTLHPSS